MKIYKLLAASQQMDPAFRESESGRLNISPKIFEKDRVDQVIEVTQEDAVLMTRRLANEEAVFAGMSSGGAAWAAVELAKTLDSGVIVSIICDRGDRYLSSDLFG